MNDMELAIERCNRSRRAALIEQILDRAGWRLGWQRTAAKQIAGLAIERCHTELRERIVPAEVIQDVSFVFRALYGGPWLNLAVLYLVPLIVRILLEFWDTDADVQEYLGP